MLLQKRIVEYASPNSPFVATSFLTPACPLHPRIIQSQTKILQRLADRCQLVRSGTGYRESRQERYPLYRRWYVKSFTTSASRVKQHTGMTQSMITAARLIGHKSINGVYQSLMQMDQMEALGQ